MDSFEKSDLNAVLIESLDTLPSGVCVWTEDDRLVFVNKFFKELQREIGVSLEPGISRLEVVRQNIDCGFLKLPHDLDIEAYLRQSKADMFAKDGGSRIELPLRDGGVLLLTNKPLSSGNYLQLYTDITTLKKHEAELEEKERRYVGVTHALNAFVFEWNIENGQTSFSIPEGVGPAAEQNMNKPLMGGLDTVFEEDRTKYKAAMIAHFKKQTPLFSCDHRARSDTGQLNWYRTRGKAIWNEQGRAVKFFGLVENIDDQKQMQLRMADIEKRSQDVLNSISAGIMVWDAKDHLVWVNKFFDRFGVPLEPGQSFVHETGKLVDKGIFSLDEGVDKQEFLEGRMAQRQALSGTAINLLPRMADGSHLQITSKRLEDGGMVQVFVDVSDLTNREEELNNLVEELNTAKQAADAANQTKSQFLANMSHELRTPLNAIIGLTEMLKEDCVDDGLEDFIEPLDRVFSAGKHLLTLINDVLDLSKIEAGKVELYNETFELEPLLQGIIQTTQTLVEQSNNEISLTFLETIDEVTNDQTRIKQIFLNLISNATKFTENGQISLNVSRQSTPQGDLVKVDVADTGIGMDEEQVGRLFNAFVQADSSTTRKYGGTGLGLTISKQLAQLMGGDVSVQSEKGKGTVFTASFALNNAGHMQTENTSAEPLITRVIPGGEPTGKKVLIIDDDPTISALMQRQLVKNGYAVLIARSGKEGLSLAKTHQPDVITLDILMPEIDGWSTLRALKADPESRHIPVIMASILDEKNKGFALGAADFLSKPIERDYLISSVQRLIGQKKAATICVIEDDQDLRFTVKEILEKTGATVLEAGHGKEAFSVLENHNELPDLLLLDLLMPVMNGFEFLQKKQATKFKAIPVLVLTGADLSSEELEILSQETLRVIEKNTESVAFIADDIAQAIEAISGAVR